MVEDRTTVLRDLTLAQPMNALRDVSMDLFHERTIRLANGRELTALDLQEEICERAEAFVASKSLPADQVRAVTMWREVLTGLRRDPLSLHAQIDWVAKYRLIEQLRAREDLALTSPKVAMVDLLYHDTDPTRGLYYKLQHRGLVERIVSDDDISRATMTPPATTRARMRGAFVKRATERCRDFTVDWVHLKLNDQLQRTLMLKDPFKSHDDRFDRLIAVPVVANESRWRL
jgi:proteasome accessory factor A